MGVYCRELLAGLASANPGTKFLHCYRSHRWWRGWRAPRPPNAAWRPLFEERQLWSSDLFHGLNQRLPRSRFKRTVCTFHDLFVMTGDYSTPEFRARFTRQAREAAARADIIIAVSRFTADQVHELLGVERSRLRVVSHGVRFQQSDAPKERIVLHVGAIQKRKNLVWLIHAFETSPASKWKLVLAGSDGYDAAEVHQRIAASAARDRIVVTGWISDDELAGWYSCASVLAFPSLDEGFGIPVLEAMAHGVPVLSSRASALEEVCGDAAVLVDPQSQEEITAGLTRLLTDNELRTELADRGRQRAALYPWERAVAETWNVYREML